MNNKKFKNIISLGYFCNVAMELEKIGLRNASYPFDWVISGSFHSVLNLISSNFNSFMEFDNLCQEYKINPKYYFDQGSNIHFYHDFSPYISLDAQYEDAKSKYQRRISRFYKDIKEPTLFVRYIASENELEYILNENDSITGLLKSFNSENEIIYISNIEAQAQNIAIFYIPKDNNDTVARSFLDKSPKLKEYIMERVDISKKRLKGNLKLAKKSIRKRKARAIGRKIKKLFNKALPFTKRKCYKHSKLYIAQNPNES